MTILAGLPFLFLLVVPDYAQDTNARLPRFDDYLVSRTFVGTPAPPKLTTSQARLYGARIREAVEKGWGVERNGKAQGHPGPNFAGNMIVAQWSSGAPGMEMSLIDAETGQVYYPPITFHGIGVESFDLPLLTPGPVVARNPEVYFRLNSSLMIIKATPKQTRLHPSFKLSTPRPKS